MRQIRGLQFCAVLSILLNRLFISFPTEIVLDAEVSGARILMCRQEFLLSFVGVLFRPQSISSLCVPMSSDLLLHGRVQTLWEKEDLKVLWGL